MSDNPIIPPEMVDMIFLVEGTNADGQELFAYVKVNAHDIGAFQQARKQAGFDPSQFGTIITHGTGAPDNETKTMMERIHGFNHKKMMDIG